MINIKQETRTMTTLAWHFVGDKLRDGRPVPPDGEWLVHDGECCLRNSGLHASDTLLDAVGYAPGSTVCRVAVHGIEGREYDKFVARERCILWRVKNADHILRAFARKAALSVAHLWDTPDVMRQYLETGDESIKAEARAAAKAIAKAIVEAPDWYFVKAPLWDAWDSISAAAWVDAWDVADVATLVSTRKNYFNSIRNIAWATARALSYVDKDITYDAALANLNNTLETMIREAAGNPDDDALKAIHERSAIEVIQPDAPWPSGVSDGLNLPCQRCGNKPKFDYHVADDVWKALVPEDERLGVICLPCLERIAHACGTSIGDAIEEVQFTGMGTTTILKPEKVYHWIPRRNNR